MRPWLGTFVLACAAGAFAAETSPTGHAPNVIVGGDLHQAAAAVEAKPLVFSVRRYASIGSKAQAYERLEAALQDLAKENGMQTVDRADAVVTVEVDSTFYVYTNRFNARLIRLPEYTQAQLEGAAPTSDEVRAGQQPDVVRIAAGALGIVRGWISPAFGSYMIAGGAAPALFGEGKAPTRLFVAGKERYERGEQEVNTKVRVLRGGEVVAMFSVRNWCAGDEPPFRIDSLVAENWTTIFGVLARRQVELHSTVEAR
jgi:hypothetical protein